MSNNKVFIIAELAQTHEGQVELAKKLILKAAQAGADAVKFHMFKADELAVPAYEHFQLLKKLEWPVEVWRDLVAVAAKHRIKFYADVLGDESLQTAIKIGVDAVKIHATDLSNESFLKKLSKVNKPLYLSAGGAKVTELVKAVSWIRKGRTSSKPLVLLYGFQNYPTQVAQANILRMRYLGEKLKLPYGYADHTAGDDPQKFILCGLAVGAGAVVLEKHLTIDRDLKMEDYESSLGPQDFKEFVLLVRGWESALGEFSESMSASELNYARSIRRQVVAATDITKGDLIVSSNLVLRRAPSKREPLLMSDVVGQRAKRSYMKDEVITQ